MAPVLLGGCWGGDDEESARLEGVCDIRRESCQKAVFQAAAEVRGQTAATMPRVQTITIQQFADMLAEQSDQDDGEETVWNALLPLLSLLPAGSTISGAATEAQVEGVAAFYSLDSKGITVIDRGQSDPQDDVFVLAHEMVHALQDQEIGLESFLTTRARSLDGLVAAKSLVEGEASVLGLGVLAKALQRPASALNWAGVQDSMRMGFFDTASASDGRLLASALTVPYWLGTTQLAPLWLAGGQAAIDAIYANPPGSVLDWADDTVVTRASRRESLDCYPTAGPPGFIAHSADSFGPIGLFTVALDAGASPDSAWRTALRLRGDSVVAFTEEGAPDSLAIAWRLRFADVSAATAFEADRARSLAPGAGVARNEREVVYFGATRPEKLGAWSILQHCGKESELPDPDASAPELAAALLRRLPRLKRNAQSEVGSP